MKRILLSLVALATICIGTNAQEVFRLGIIGLDTSHSARFSQLLNDPESPDPIVRKFEVVVAYPYGTTTIESASKRIPQYIEEVQKYGVKVVDSIQRWMMDQFLKTNGVAEGAKDYYGVIGMIMTLNPKQEVSAPVPDYRDNGAVLMEI